MSAEAIQKAYETFVNGFLHPLLVGGTVELGSPITPGMLENFALSRPADRNVDMAIYDRLHWYAGEIAPVRGIPWPSRGLMAIASACHGLAFATDPMLERMFARSARKKVLSYVDWFIQQAGPPRTRGEALSRHVVLDRFFDMRRMDTTASNWAFTHKYIGRPVPSGVLTKPRWVDISKDQKQLPNLLLSLARVRNLASRSPLSQFLRTDRFGPFDFGAANLAVLSDDLVRHGVARVLTSQGAKVQSVFGNALHALYRAGPPTTLLYFPIALIYEAHVISCIDEGAEPSFNAGSDAGSALFAAILPALVGAPDDLGAILELDPMDLEIVRAQAARFDKAIDPSILKLVVAVHSK